MRYNVVFRNIAGGVSNGCITWSTFGSKKNFDEWYDEQMKAWYQIVEEGVSKERAVQLCSTPEATVACIRSMLGELNETLNRVCDELEGLSEQP